MLCQGPTKPCIQLFLSQGIEIREFQERDVGTTEKLGFTWDPWKRNKYLVVGIEIELGLHRSFERRSQVLGLALARWLSAQDDKSRPLTIRSHGHVSGSWFSSLAVQGYFKGQDTGTKLFFLSKRCVRPAPHLLVKPFSIQTAWPLDMVAANGHFPLPHAPDSQLACFRALLCASHCLGMEPECPCPWYLVYVSGQETPGAETVWETLEIWEEEPPE